MIKLYKKLENKFYKYSIPKLYFYIIAAIVIGYVLCYLFPSVYYYLPFNPYEVVYNHQYWRLFTWIFEIPFSLRDPLNMLFLPLSLYFYYFVGRTLEAMFGKFSFNLYVLGGWFFSTLGMIGATVYMFYLSPVKDVYTMLYRTLIDQYKGDVEIGFGFGGTHYMLTSIFFAFALIFGEMQVRLWMIIPFKVKWSAWITAAFMAYDFYKGQLPKRVVIVMCILNFIIYYFTFKSMTGRSLKTIKRQMVYKQKIRAASQGRQNVRNNTDVRPQERKSNVYRMPAGKAIHKCAICGRSEQDGENMEFRYCSKCNGDLEYCQDHLYTHTHVTGNEDSSN